MRSSRHQGVKDDQWFRSAAKRTTRQFLALAPSGILIYTIWQGIAYIQEGKFSVTEQ